MQSFRYLNNLPYFNVLRCILYFLLSCNLSCYISLLVCAASEYQSYPKTRKIEQSNKHNPISNHNPINHTHPGLILVRESDDFVMYSRTLSSSFHIVVFALLVAVLDVVQDGVVEEHSVLGYHSDITTQAFLSVVPQVLPINQDTTSSNIVQTENKSQDGTFAFPCATHLLIAIKHSKEKLL